MTIIRTSLVSINKTAKSIAFLHLSLLFLTIVFYFLKGFDREELTSLIAILAPVSALYGGIAFNALSNSNLSSNKPTGQINNTIVWLVWGHFIAIGFLISLKALFPNILNFEDMILLLGVVESYFGAHMGTLMHKIFRTN